MGSTNSSGRQTQIPQSKVPAQIDRPRLMIALAEEFFEAAHKLAPGISVSMSPEALEEYHKLMATGLGVLDAILKHGKMPPRMEANIRLRYAGVLYEETENSMEAESTLGKGIALCDRVCTANHYVYTSNTLG